MHDNHQVDIRHLVSLFYPDSPTLMTWEKVDSGRLPADYQRLLDHDAHMTVTLESHHASLVDVEVLRVSEGDGYYARESILRRQSDGQAVQFGIIRLATRFLPPDVMDRIRSGAVPLGRVLIDRNVLREVQLQGLWEIQPGERLRTALPTVQANDHVYGRTAIIVCDQQPAIQLLEIPLP